MTEHPDDGSGGAQQAQRWLLALRDGAPAEKAAARRGLAAIFEARGMLSEAVELLESNVREGHQDAELIQTLARLYRARGDEHLAESAALEATRLLDSRQGRGSTSPEAAGPAGDPRSTQPPPGHDVQEAGLSASTVAHRSSSRGAVDDPGNRRVPSWRPSLRVVGWSVVIGAAIGGLSLSMLGAELRGVSELSPDISTPTVVESATLHPTGVTVLPAAIRATPPATPAPTTAPLPTTATASSGAQLVPSPGASPTAQAASPVPIAEAGDPEPPTTTHDSAPWLAVAHAGPDGVRLRASPGSGEPLKVVSDGTRLESLREERQEAGRSWHRVRDADGVQGWVASEFLMPTSAPADASTAGASPTAESDPAVSTANMATSTPTGTSRPADADQASPRAGACPASHPIKGNVAASGERIYHRPGGAFYRQTNPEACFATEADARAGGFRPSRR
jgi:hypothetical protein